MAQKTVRVQSLAAVAGLSVGVADWSVGAAAGQTVGAPAFQPAVAAFRQTQCLFHWEDYKYAEIIKKKQLTHIAQLSCTNMGTKILFKTVCKIIIN